MINASNFTSKNNSPWLLEAVGGDQAARPSQPGGPASDAAGRATPARPGRSLAGGVRALAAAVRILLSWLAATPARLGDRLFVMNDTEAYWRSWQIIRTHGGLGRGYRDPRFDLLEVRP